jgi:dGTPase
MEPNRFSGVASSELHPQWEAQKNREGALYDRPADIRSPFARDHGRLLHCTAYRRLKHKTQVFFAPQNDHICTRIEHVNHVASVSATIGKHLGLNVELITAIALGHDLGHTPFGHHGESVLKSIVQEGLGGTFWHEQNSLHFVDDLETLPDPRGAERNLDLTYAVRDGIICHCGEVDEESLRPRNEAINLDTIRAPSQVAPFTWEACIVKVADKIAYLGRDIEDALTLGILTRDDGRKLRALVRRNLGLRLRHMNNTALIHRFVIDLCTASTPEEGIRLSADNVRLMRTIREFSAERIYNHPRLNCYKEYAKVVIRSIFSILAGWYRSRNTLAEIQRHERLYPLLTRVFHEWIAKYSDLDDEFRQRRRFENRAVYDLREERDYLRAVIDFIGGMTDNFAIRVFAQLTSF